MKIITLRFHIDIEEARTIISFIDELKTVLLANYGGEIRQNHRIRFKLDAEQAGKGNF